MTLEYRLFQERDLESCLALWSECSGWGELSESQWREWYVDCPEGPAVIIVAVEESGDIAGQTFLLRRRIRVGDRTVDGLRFSAPIIAGDWRQSELRDYEHPTVGLLRISIATAIEQNYSLMYTLPAAGWLKFFQWATKTDIAEFNVEKFGCVQVDLTDPEIQTRGGGIECRPISEFGPQFEMLWNESLENPWFRCAVVRDPKCLNFRNGRHINLEVTKDSRTIGYVSVNRQSGLIADLFADSVDQVQNVLHTAIDFAAKHRVEYSLPPVVKALEHPMLKSTLRECGFNPIRYRFAFVCLDLSPGDRQDEIVPSNWYLAGGD